MTTGSDLSLYEQMLLLSLHDDRGTVHGYYTSAIGGALLAELVLSNRVRLEPGKRHSLVTLVDGSRTGDSLLDECINMIAGAKRRTSPAGWVGHFSSIRHLVDRIAKPLADRGILHREKGRLLWIFRRTVYPTSNPGPETQLTKAIGEAIEREGPVDTRLAVIIGVAHSTELLNLVFPRDLLKRRKIVKMNAVGEATKDAVAAAMTAVFVASTVGV